MLISVILGVSLIACVVRGIRCAETCSEPIARRWSRVHCPFLASLISTSAAFSWAVGLGGAEGNGWPFVLHTASVAVSLAMGVVLVFGRDRAHTGGASAALWASSIVALLIAGSDRVRLIDGQIDRKSVV